MVSLYIPSGRSVVDETNLRFGPADCHNLQAAIRREWIETNGLGSVSEIFDADPPHTPRGCISQAWSVGTLLEVCAQLELIPKKL
jgi:glycogen debranching enzyme